MAFCTACGKQIPESSKFCAGCGKPFGGAAAAPAPERQPLDYSIEGDNLQILRVRLKPGQEIFAEAGRMVYKHPSVNWESKASGESLGAKLWGMVKRKLS